MLDTETKLLRLSLPVICSDYDKECREVTIDEARKCFEGGWYHGYDIPQADGICPILAKLN